MQKNNSNSDAENFKKELEEAEKADQKRYKLFLFSKKHKKKLVLFNIIYFICWSILTHLIGPEIFASFLLIFSIYIVAFTLSMLRKEKENSGRGFLIAYTALVCTFLIPLFYLISLLY